MEEREGVRYGPVPGRTIGTMFEGSAVVRIEKKPLASEQNLFFTSCRFEVLMNMLLVTYMRLMCTDLWK